MKQFKGLGYDATGIEHDFAIFFGDRIGDRSTSHDADLFRSGRIAGLGVNLERFCQHLERRLSQHGFYSAEAASGSPAARLKIAVKSISRIATAMKESTETEPQDYHWLIISDLVLVIGSLFDQLEEQASLSFIENE